MPEPGGRGLGEPEGDGVAEVSPAADDDRPVVAPADGTATPGPQHRDRFGAFITSDPKIEVGRSCFQLVSRVHQEASIADIESPQDAAAGELRLDPGWAAEEMRTGAQTITPAPNSSIPINGLILD